MEQYVWNIRWLTSSSIVGCQRKSFNDSFVSVSSWLSLLEKKWKISPLQCRMCPLCDVTTSFRWHAALQILPTWSTLQIALLTCAERHLLSGGHFATSRLNLLNSRMKIKELKTTQSVFFSRLTIRKPSLPNFRQPTDVNHLQQQKTKAQHSHQAPLGYSSTGSFYSVAVQFEEKGNSRQPLGHFATRGEDRTTEKGRTPLGWIRDLQKGSTCVTVCRIVPVFCFCCGGTYETHSCRSARLPPLQSRAPSNCTFTFTHFPIHSVNTTSLHPPLPSLCVLVW